MSLVAVTLQAWEDADFDAFLYLRKDSIPGANTKRRADLEQLLAFIDELQEKKGAAHEVEDWTTGVEEYWRLLYRRPVLSAVDPAAFKMRVTHVESSSLTEDYLADLRLNFRKKQSTTTTLRPVFPPKPLATSTELLEAEFAFELVGDKCGSVQVTHYLQAVRGGSTEPWDPYSGMTAYPLEWNAKSQPLFLVF